MGQKIPDRLHSSTSAPNSLGFLASSATIRWAFGKRKVEIIVVLTG